MNVAPLTRDDAVMDVDVLEQIVVSTTVTEISGMGFMVMFNVVSLVHVSPFRLR